MSLIHKTTKARALLCVTVAMATAVTGPTALLAATNPPPGTCHRLELGRLAMDGSALDGVGCLGRGRQAHARDPTWSLQALAWTPGGIHHGGTVPSSWESRDGWGRTGGALLRPEGFDSVMVGVPTAPFIRLTRTGTTTTAFAPSVADEAMERYSRGDDRAFEVVYDEVAPMVLRYLRRRVASDEVAEDLLQETLLHVHRARGSFIAGAPVMPWCYAIARRLMCDSRRVARRRVMLVEVEDICDFDQAHGEHSPEEMAIAREICECVNRSLADMPASQRDAFELLRVDGASTQEAAGVLGTTALAVKLRVHRAYESLRRAMKGPS